MSNRRRPRRTAPTPQSKRNLVNYTPGSQRLLANLRESATAPALERTELREAVTHALAEAPTRAGGSLIVPLILIEAGWNTAGTRYYEASALARDIPTVFPKGTRMYINHPTPAEAEERPERDLFHLAATLIEDPYTTDGGKTMRADARVYSTHRQLITEAWQEIGVSINANGTGSFGEREGRKGLVVDAITYGKSIDFVTAPGAGGRIVALLESARTAVPLREARTFGAWLESRLHLTLTRFADEAYGDGRLTREERITLSSAIGDGLKAWTSRVEAEAPQLFQRDLYDDPSSAVAAVEAERLTEATTEEIRAGLDRAIRSAYGTRDTYAWVRDWDADRSLVWYEAGSGDEPHTWQQSYALTDGKVLLAGDRVEVAARTVYEPVSAAMTEADAATPPEVAVSSPTDSPVATPADSTTSSTEDAPGSPPADDETEGVMPEDLTTEVKAREAAEQARTEAETKLTEALREAEDAKRTAADNALRLARFEALDAARPIATTALAESDLPAAARARVLDHVTTDVPLTEAHILDEAALKTRIEGAVKAEAKYLADLQEADGAGQITGLGVTASPLREAATPVADATAVQTALVESYKARGMSAEAATLAARGRPF